MNVARQIEAAIQALSAYGVTNGFLAIISIVFVSALTCGFTGRAHGFVRYAPNLLTTLGILGTFFGIVIGLAGFDIQNITQSIGPLLAGMKTAFFTSLFGMMLAILFKVIDSFGVIHARRAVHVDAEVGPREIHQELREQTAALQSLKQSIIDDSDSSLTSQVRLLRSEQRDWQKTDAAARQEFTQQLWSRLEDFAQMMSKSATEQVIEALNQVIHDFNEKLTEQFGENFKQLNEAVLRLVEWQENYRVQLEQMKSQFDVSVQSLSEAERTMTTIGQEVRHIPETMRSLSTLLTSTQHQIQELERHLEAFAHLRDRAVEALPRVQQQMDELTRQVAEAAKNSGQRIEMAMASASKAILEGAEEFEARVNRTNENLTGASDYLVQSTETIKQNLTDGVVDLQESIRELVEAVDTNSASLGKTLVEANTTLATSVKEVQYQVTDSIQQMEKRLEASIEQVFSEQAAATSRAVAGLQEDLRSMASRTGDAVNKQLEAMDQAMQQELERTISVLGSNLAAITQRFTDDYQRLTTQMATVVGAARSVRGVDGVGDELA